MKSSTRRNFWGFLSALPFCSSLAIAGPTKPGPCECVSGDRVILKGLPHHVHAAVLNAFVSREKDHRTGDVTVKLECLAAQQLLFALSTSMRTNFIRAER